MTEAQLQENLQNALIQQYYLNLEFLKEHDLILYNKINTFSTMIDEGYYKERFALEFIKENGQFDILNIEENSYLYGRNENLINEHFLNGCDFTKNSVFNSLTLDLYLPRKKDIEIYDEKFDILDRIIYSNMSEYASVLGHCYSDNKEYNQIDKFIFFGNLLGTHLKYFQEKIGFKTCLIYEPNLEIFRLSLFVTDYRHINQKSKIIFSIMDDENILIEKVNIFFRTIFMYSNYNIKYHKMINVDNDIFNKILNELYLSNGSTYDYTKLLFDTFYSLSKHINKYKILTTKNKSNDFTLLENKPVILVAAGPSLSKNIEWLRENQNKFIIVAIGAVYKKLYDNGITADIVTTVDPKYHVLNQTHFNKTDVQILKDTIVLASINTPTRILDRFNQEKLFLYEVVDPFKNNSNVYNGISIGEITLHLLLDMNIKDLYLLGTDLAFDEKTGQSHFEGYVNKRDDFEKENSKINDVLETGNSSRKEFIEVKGNKKDKVITNRIFALSINQYIRIINFFKKPYQNIYNLCENGAYIEGTIFKNIEEIKEEKIIENKKELFNNIMKISEFGLLKNEYEELDRKLETLRQIRKTLNDLYVKQKESTSLEKFNEKFSVLSNFIIRKKDRFFIGIIKNYFNFVLPYVYDSLNDKKLSNDEIKLKLKKVEIIFLKQINSLIDVYESYLIYIKKGDR